MKSPASILTYFQETLVPGYDMRFPSIKMYGFEKQKSTMFASDMEGPAQSFHPNKIEEKNFAHSGIKVSVLDGKDTYSATFEDRVGAFSKDATKVSACGWVYYHDKNADAVFVVSFENKSGSILYKTVSATSGPQNKWFRVCQTIEIPGQCRPDDIVKVYFWNKTASPVYVDDIAIAEIKD
jgi:hypothetical protein